MPSSANRGKHLRPRRNTGITDLNSRALTPDEVALTSGVFGDAIAYDRVRILRRKWWPFHPAHITMAPDGHLWFHPHADHYCEDFCGGSLSLQAHFLHEMTHVWQAQTKGRWYLPLMRHPWCRYDYVLEPGKPFARYGLEQQAEIVRHVFLHRHGVQAKGAGDRSALEALLPFGRG